MEKIITIATAEGIMAAEAKWSAKALIAAKDAAAKMAEAAEEAKETAAKMAAAKWAAE